MFERLSRRTMLKGVGTAIALPFLEAMTPTLCLAGVAHPKPPKRMAFFYVPNGIWMADWTPKSEGTNFELHSTLEPLAPLKHDLMVLTGLTCDKARANGDGPGDHARAMSSFLTGVQVRKTAGADIKAGVSVDQIAAQQIGSATRFPSLELGCESGRTAGNCDSGYSCAYSSSISWRSEATPMGKEVNPRLVFERLFASPSKNDAEAASAKRERYKTSILDFVTEDAHRIRMRLGATDQRKMDEYLTAVRELEVRITRVGQVVPSELGNVIKPTGVPREYDEHIRLLTDMLVLAFQGDLTRLATFVYANDGSNRSYRFIDVPDGHHDISHHQRNPEKIAKIKKINHFHISQFAYFLAKLKNLQEGEGSLLDSCMVVYGSGISDGNRHNHNDLPILLAGKGGGTLRTGQHRRYPDNTPLTNLYVSMLERMEVSVEKFGDSNGKITDLV